MVTIGFMADANECHLWFPLRGGVYELGLHICRGKTTDGSKDDAAAHLKLPEFPKDDDKRVPPPLLDPKPFSLTPAESNSATPFVLSDGLPPVPAKLVAKIQKGDYMDMAELLRDNMEYERRQTTSESKSGRASRREVPDLLSWITCFGIYASVICDKSSEKAKQLLAYQTLIVRKACRCGGKGWQTYNSMFRGGSRIYQRGVLTNRMRAHFAR